jgi:hypothetical protein
MQEVRDGTRILQFEGTRIASSSSQRPGAYRWIEFNLFRTIGGQYILSRIGHSLLFHQEPCLVIKRNNLKPGDAVEGAMPCDLCSPSLTNGVAVFLEQPRYWAQVSDSPEAVLDALYKYDEAGARYLTRVAQNLVTDAALVDNAMDSAYRIEHVL